LKLEIHPEKSKIINMNKEEAEFEFLGYKFHREKKRAIIVGIQPIKVLRKCKTESERLQNVKMESA